MRPSDTPSSPSFPALEPIILDAEMENIYGDKDMEFFNPSVLDASSPRHDRGEDFFPGTAGNQAIANSIAPSQLGVKQPHRDADNSAHAPNPPPPESLSDSPGDSSGSCSSTSSGNHFRHTSFNSTFSGAFGESPTLSKQYPPSWSNANDSILGIDTDFNTMSGFSMGADIESSNKAMDSAFDFEGAASSPSPLKVESTPPAESQNVSPRTRMSGISKASDQASHSKSSSHFSQPMSPFHFQGSRDHSPSSAGPGLSRSTSNGWDGPSPSAGLEETFGDITMNGGSPLNPTLSPSLNFGQGGLSFESPEAVLMQQKQGNPFTPLPSAGLSGPTDPRPSVLLIHPTALKSRVETQIPIRMSLYPPPAGVKKLRLPAHTISKPKFLAKPDTKRSPEILELHTSLFCTSAMQDEKKLANAFKLAAGNKLSEQAGKEEEKALDGAEVKICAGCIQRERKRASRKKQRKPDEDELFQKSEEKRVIVFNTNEIKDWTEPSTNAPPCYSDIPAPNVPPDSLQVELPMRIACYCRHQSEKIGFQVIFTVKDYRDNVVAQAITNSIMITDDHKTHTPSTAPPPQPPTLSSGTQLPGAGVFVPSPIPENKGNNGLGKHPFRPSQSTTDLQNIRNQPDLQFPTAQGFTIPQNGPGGPSATPTPRNLSRQASPTGLQGPSSKRRKQSGVAKVPTNLTMTKLETTPQPSPSTSTTPSTMPMSHFSPNNQSFRPPTERGYAIPSNNLAQFANGPPTPNSNDTGFFGANQPQSAESMSQPQLVSAPSSAHPSRPGTPGASSRGSFQEQNILASLNQASSNQLWPSSGSTQRLPSIIHKLVPAEGSTTGGTEVTLLGSGFYPGMEVVFGDTLATTTTFWGEKCLNCLTPPALQPGTVPVVFKHEHPNFGPGLPNRNQPMIPRQLSYRYVDDRELQMYRLALGVLGQKLRNPSDAFQTAQQIMGGDPSNLWNLQNNFQGNGGGHQRQVPGQNNTQSDMSDLDSKMLTYLEFIDLDDNPRPPRFNTPSATGQTLLHLASSLGLTRFVAGLLARGANPDVVDSNGNTPMHLAAISGHAHIVRRLRLAGADATIQSIREFTPADLATTLAAHQEALIPARHFRSRSVDSSPSPGRQRRSRSASFGSVGVSVSPTRSSDYSVDDSTDSADDRPESRDSMSGLRSSKSHPNLKSVFSFPRPQDGTAQVENVETVTSPVEPAEDTRSFSPPAALVDWRNQLAAQINQFQQSVNRAFPNLPALPPMPALPDYQAHPMMRRITSLVPHRPTTPWPASISTEGWWDMLKGNQSPPAYEELYPKPGTETDEDYSVKKSSMVQAAADAALDQQFERPQASSSSSRKSHVKEEMGDVRISSKVIPREQQEQLRMAHARKIKKIRSDRNLFFIWIPLLVLVVVAMLRNLIPDAWHGIKQVSEFISSSKVTVECTDPSGIFPLVSPLINEQLPLRSLHWKSPTRPLRSIDSLHIDLVPAKPTVVEQKRSSDGSSTAPLPQRRHQIPGLRQTPYLKVYLLRCDDNETYKSSARKLLREWVKSQGSSSSGGSASSQENHDASEWLIIHVIQDTGNEGGLERTPSTSKWPGRGSTTVLEKVKADFNGSSKSSVDRVAQLKIPKEGSAKRPADLPAQLDDLVEKLKYSILTSFDRRVTQYEEDIREKASQRNLPGWNFCTFFILKEGLAKGFENVGLYEDALVWYDELSAGLDTAIHDHTSGVGDQHGGTFLDYSNDLMEKAKAALGQKGSKDSDQSEDEDDDDEDDDDDDNDDDNDEMDDKSINLELEAELFPLESHKKPYRDMILANNISAFDFRSYVFSRQLMLLLQAANASSLQKMGAPEKAATAPKGEAEDFILLSEICERGTEFIGVGARTLRNELEYVLEQLEEGKGNDALREETVHNLVSSWTYAATSQILTQTATDALVIPESTFQNLEEEMETSSIADAVANTRPGVPKRSSSLAQRRPSSRDILSPGTYDNVPASSPYEAEKQLQPVSNRTGSEELASGRGELYLMARRTLEEIGRRHRWSENWKGLDLLYDDDGDIEGDLEEVSLDTEEPAKKPEASKGTKAYSNGIEAAVLERAIKSKKGYNRLYLELTDQTYRHFIAANRTKSAEMAMADIALLKYRAGEYFSAASYFHQMAPFYGGNCWNTLEGSILELYARSLKKLEKNDDYTRILLKLLSKYAGYTKLGPKKVSGISTSTPLSRKKGLVSDYVEDLVKSSQALQGDITVPLSDLFGNVEVSPIVSHHEDRDGFRLTVSLRFLLSRSVNVDSIKVHLTNSGGPQSELWLENSEGVTVKSSSTKITLDSCTTFQGKFLVDTIVVRVGRILFIQNNANQNPLTTGLRDTSESALAEQKPQYVFCFSPPNGLEAKISPPHHIDLEELRAVELELESGWNNISSATVRIRPATAGLRLRLTDATLVDGQLKVRENAESGNIEFEDFKAGSSARFKIPYTQDDNQTTLVARLEVEYNTEHGAFTYLATNSVVSTLPVSVNVQDMFKDEVLFSRFTVSPGMMTPLRILSCEIPSSDLYEVQSSYDESMVLDVFPKQPASLLYKIIQREGTAEALTKRNPLALAIEFTCLDEACLAVIETQFKQDLRASPFKGLCGLLVPHLLEALRTQWTAGDLEVVGLTREVETLSYESVGWGSITELLPADLRTGTEQWLTEWHQVSNHQHHSSTSNHPFYPFRPVSPKTDIFRENNQKTKTLPVPTPSQQKQTPPRRIVIPVDVPEMQVVHTAELHLLNMIGQQHPHAAVGQILTTELHLQHTRRWCSSVNQETASLLEFSYEIHANPDMWLVGGMRRGNFTAKEGETTCFTVMLLPQRAGHLLLPGVEVKTFVAEKGAAAADDEAGLAPQRKQVPCEVDYLNHGETVLVLPDLRKTTVCLDPTGSGSSGSTANPNPATGGSWLVDSERRGVESC
ncbi:hypothetical protein FQN54_008960 [Arachnomyces sp. PD_36]|nr:hypothetical protein FQN54_008960 [Arachnomyces sp. PD_36]